MARITVVDSLRGFSLIGILLANLLIFQFGMYGASYPDFYQLDDINKLLLSFDHIFIHGSFMPIFVLLFGFGLVKMSESLMRRKLPVKRALLRRGLMLFIFGILHAMFLFSGDILYLYGTIIFFITWIVKRNVKVLYISIILSVILTFTLIYANKDALMMIADAPISNSLTKEQSQYLTNEKEIFSKGTNFERNTFLSEAEDPFLDIGDNYGTIFLVAILVYLPLFILGMIFAKNKFFEKGMTKTKVILMYLTPIFLLIKGLNLFYPENEIIASLLLLGDFGLSFSYIAIFYSLYQKFNHGQIFKSFEAVGKLSLTNYIGQSIFHSFIYYGYGLGRFGDNNFILSFVIALAFFVFQIIFSTIYLKYFKYGPLEYIIRVFTYWSFHPKKVLK
ncbi:DUF418 domain-containing protein [Macrococcus sp. EM39E]|uniref:DUF418 domain-containing protein n=1 Tax=Macrococcus animalis TaxID=3395467 RepID=UPI0039BFA02D